MKAFGVLFGLFFVALGVAFGVLGALDVPERAGLTFWILAASFVATGLLVAAISWLVARSVARVQSLVTSSSIVVEDGTGAGPDPEHLEQAVRQALAAKGVTGALQDEAVAKTLAAASSGERAVDLREYTRGEGFQEAGAEEAAAPDPVDQLERLAKLRDRGVISEGEFAAAKARLLSEL